MKKQNDYNTEMTEATAVKSNVETRKASRLWKNVLVGGVPAILMGAGVAALAHDQGEENPIDELISQPEEPIVIRQAFSVNDDMTYDEAFAAARAEVGAGGAFCWHGHVYGTHLSHEPEWLAMSEAERAAHSQAILAQVHATPYTPSEDEPEIVPVEEETVVEEVAAPAEEVAAAGEAAAAAEEAATLAAASSPEEDLFEEDEEFEDGDVRILGVGEAQEDGDIQVISNEGENAVFADADGDDVVDTVLIETVDEDPVAEEPLADPLDSEHADGLMDLLNGGEADLFV